MDPQREKNEIGPEQGLPDGIGIGDSIEVFARHSHVWDVLKIQITCTVCKRVYVQVGNTRAGHFSNQIDVCICS